ncbi:MAG TPA: glycosyltransferase family 39 protein [Candidatus Nanoarchaeia archaeon]|nr:glycosyltransferase family 39 protein [Candidatus Nanoarchaeia archaeon]
MKLSKTALILTFLVILAFSLRLYSAHHVDLATDEMIYSLIPLNIISAERLSTVEQSPVYFYLADLGYKLLGGLTAISSRFTSVIYGSLAAILIYLLTLELFGRKKEALLAAFFAAVSGYILHFSIEMDMVAYFFSLFAAYYFIIAWKRDANKYFYFSFVLASLAVLIKSIALIFFIVLLFALVIKLWLKDGSAVVSAEIKRPKKGLIIIAVCLLLSLVIVSPVLIYNYLLYQDKGITDYYFSVIGGVGETVHQGLQGKPWTLSRLSQISQGKLQQFLTLDGPLLIFGIIGLALSFKKERWPTVLLLFLIAIPFIYLAGQTSSASHYLFVPLFLSIFAGHSAVVIGQTVKDKFRFRHFILLVMIITSIFTITTLVKIEKLREQSIVLSLQSYAQDTIPDNALIVIDPRIYNGIHAWVFNKQHYLAGISFPQLLNQLEGYSGATVTAPLYYIECSGKTYCGWKPEDFDRISKSGEELSAYFQERLVKIYELKSEHQFSIYRGEIKIPPAVYEAVDRTHQFWFYPVGWKYPENAVDNYTTDGLAEKMLNKIGFTVLYLDVLMALLAILLTLWLGLRTRELVEKK